PVVWVQHADDELPKDSPQWQWVPELLPLPSEPLITKQFNSAFEQTPLDSVLQAIDATHIVLAGAATNWCIRATAYGALDRGYDLTLVGDAHTTGTMRFDDGTVIEAADIIKELNIAITWLAYPDRKNGALLVEDLDFALPGPPAA
ncbi:MAG: isochorismatase family protein, partial [Oscillochloris sp.]|nr:isochorismatase family protein [Oscillochloris sp.]